jgi:hypothetical protein
MTALYVAANLCPCWSHAQSSLPHFWILYPVPIAHIFLLRPAQTQNYYNTDDINMPQSSSVGHNNITLT